MGGGVDNEACKESGSAILMGRVVFTSVPCWAAFYGQSTLSGRLNLFPVPSLAAFVDAGWSCINEISGRWEVLH